MEYANRLISMEKKFAMDRKRDSHIRDLKLFKCSKIPNWNSQFCRLLKKFRLFRAKTCFDEYNPRVGFSLHRCSNVKATERVVNPA